MATLRRFGMILLVAVCSFSIAAQEHDRLAAAAEALGLPFPLGTTTADRVEIEDKINDVTHRYAERKLGEFDTDLLSKEAEKKFRVWSVGDTIEVVDGRGRRLSGKLSRVNRAYLQVGSTRVNSVDFTEEIWAHINQNKSDLAQLEYVEQHREEHDAKLRQIRWESRPKAGELLFRKHGFILHEGKWLTDEECRDLLHAELRRQDAEIATQEREARVKHQTAAVSRILDRESRLRVTRETVAMLKEIYEDQPLATNLPELSRLIGRHEDRLFAEDQRAKGLILHDGRWLTPEEKEVAEESAVLDGLVMSKAMSRVRYRVLQSLEHGLLCITSDDKPFFLPGIGRKFIADGETFTTDLYWAGTYTYATTQGMQKTVNCYSPKKQHAKEIAKLHFAAESSANAAGRSGGPGPPKGSGTGFVVAADGHLLTNAHVVEGAESVRVKKGREMYDAKVIGVDRETDLALLKIEAQIPPVVFAGRELGQLGQTVFTVGFPLPDLQGSEPKVTKGILSGLKGLQDAPTSYQIDAAVQPGNSGGPLCDDSGNVIGVVVAKLNAIAVLGATGNMPENVNYAIKKAYVLAFLSNFPKVVDQVKTAGVRMGTFEGAVGSVCESVVQIEVR